MHGSQTGYRSKVALIGQPRSLDRQSQTDDILAPNRSEADNSVSARRYSFSRHFTGCRQDTLTGYLDGQPSRRAVKVTESRQGTLTDSHQSTSTDSRHGTPYTKASMLSQKLTDYLTSTESGQGTFDGQPSRHSPHQNKYMLLTPLEPPNPSLYKFKEILSPKQVFSCEGVKKEKKLTGQAIKKKPSTGTRAPHSPSFEGWDE